MGAECRSRRTATTLQRGAGASRTDRRAGRPLRPDFRPHGPALRACALPRTSQALVPHPISHPISDYAVGFGGTDRRHVRHKVADSRDGMERRTTGRNSRQRITKPLHCHCANPAKLFRSLEVSANFCFLCLLHVSIMMTKRSMPDHSDSGQLLRFRCGI